VKWIFTATAGAVTQAPMAAGCEVMQPLSTLNAPACSLLLVLANSQLAGAGNQRHQLRRSLPVHTLPPRVHLAAAAALCMGSS